jgi:hypothetical protein
VAGKSVLLFGRQVAAAVPGVATVDLGAGWDDGFPWKFDRTSLIFEGVRSLGFMIGYAERSISIHSYRLHGRLLCMLVSVQVQIG